MKVATVYAVHGAMEAPPVRERLMTDGGAVGNRGKG